MQLTQKEQKVLSIYQNWLKKNKLNDKCNAYFISKTFMLVFQVWNSKEMIIEFERTRKSKDRFENKLDTYYRDLQNRKEILWLVPNESMKKFVDEQIKAYNWKLEQHHIEIFNDS